jgi:hypothetical protein
LIFFSCQTFFVDIFSIFNKSRTPSCNQYDAGEFFADSIKILKVSKRMTRSRVVDTTFIQNTTTKLEGVHLSIVLAKLSSVCISCTDYTAGGQWAGFLCTNSEACKDTAAPTGRTKPTYAFPNGPVLPFPSGGTCKPSDAATYV